MAIEVVAQARKGQGRVPRAAASPHRKVPGFSTGARNPTVSIELDHNPRTTSCGNESFTRPC